MYEILTNGTWQASEYRQFRFTETKHSPRDPARLARAFLIIGDDKTALHGLREGIAAHLAEPDTLRFPVPDLIVEVLSPTTEARDRGIKFQDYAMHGVAEYWIVDSVAEAVEQYRLAGDAYPSVFPQQSSVAKPDAIGLDRRFNPV